MKPIANVRTRDLIGRRIVGVEWNRFHVRPETDKRFTTTDPVLILDNGARLSFVVAETESQEYGVELCLARPAKV